MLEPMPNIGVADKVIVGAWVGPSVGWDVGLGENVVESIKKSSVSDGKFSSNLVVSEPLQALTAKINKAI